MYKYIPLSLFEATCVYMVSELIALKTHGTHWTQQSCLGTQIRTFICLMIFKGNYWVSVDMRLSRWWYNLLGLICFSQQHLDIITQGYNGI